MGSTTMCASPPAAPASATPDSRVSCWLGADSTSTSAAAVAGLDSAKGRAPGAPYDLNSLATLTPPSASTTSSTASAVLLAVHTEPGLSPNNTSILSHSRIFETVVNLCASVVGGNWYWSEGITYLSTAVDQVSADFKVYEVYT